MRFTGEVRVPEVDHPGVPAEFVIEDDQAEMILDGESLGRWSLFDVRAERLVSSAFSISLAGDEVTFIADEPMDFAYKGVEHMAETWARYKAMTLPRRMVAVGRSRRGIMPSRIDELRQAMLANLAAQVEFEAGPEPVAPRATTPAPAPPVASVATQPPPPAAPAPAEDLSSQPAPIEAHEPPVDDAAPLRPGPGLFGRPTARKPVPPPIPAEPAVPDLAEPESVFAPEPEPLEEEPVPEALPDLASPEAFPEPMAPSTPEPGEPDIPAATEAPASESLEEPSADEHEAPDAVEADVAPAKGRFVVDLGAFEEESEPVAPSPPREPAMAVAEPGDRSGLLGAVRAAFVRNKGTHVHEFVAAPGGIGIVRHICNECGYISIGVSEIPD